MKVYNKLVRDKIPQIIELSGKEYTVRKLNSEEYRLKLNEKLKEELDEYFNADNGEKIKELADLVEVVYAIVENQGYSIEEFEKIRMEKREKRGGFKERILLVNVSNINDKKEDIFKQFNSTEEKTARMIDEYILSLSKDVNIKKPITDCIGYKLGNRKKFATLTTKRKHTLIIHIGEKHEKLGIKLQSEIDHILGESYPRTNTDNKKYPHEVYIRLEWITDFEEIKQFILKNFENQTKMKIFKK